MESKEATDRLYLNYKNAVKDGNAIIHKQEKEYNNLIQSIERIERARIELGKTLIIRHYKYINQLARIHIDKQQIIESSIQKINTKVTLQPLFKPNENPFLPLSYTKYIPEPIIQNSNVTNLLELLDFDFVNPISPEPTTADTTTFTNKSTESLTLPQVFNKLKSGIGLTSEESENVGNLLNTSEGCLEFVGLLSKFTRYPITLKGEAYQSLSSCCYYLLTSCLNSGEVDPYVLNIVLEASRQVALALEDEKEFLYLQIVQHSIWQSIDVWRAVINSAIENRISCNKEISKKKEVKDKSKFRDMFNKVKGAVTGGVSILLQTKDTEEDVSVYDTTVWRGTLYVLNSFCYYLSTPYIDQNQVIQLYREFAKKYNIPKEKLRELEQELGKCQNELKDRAVTKCIRKLKQRKKYCKPELHILAMTIKFINNKILLRHILTLGKNANRVLKLKVYRQVLVRLNLNLSLKLRIEIWSSLLNIVNS